MLFFCCLGNLRGRDNEGDLSWIDAGSQVQNWRPVLGNLLQPEGAAPEIEGHLDGPAKPDGAVKRRGELDGGLVPDVRLRADRAVDVAAERLCKRVCLTCIEHHEADVVL